MRFAFMTFSTPELSLSDTLAAAKQFGYDGIEPRIDCGHAHGIEVAATASERTSMRDAAEREGIAFCCVATSLAFSADGDMDQKIKEAHERIDLAGDLGAPTMRIFGGSYGKDVTPDEAVERMLTAFSAVADHAAERNVTLCFETHDAWCDPERVAAVLQETNHPHIAANWDIMHPVRTKLATIDESFAALKPWIKHLHIHDGIQKPDGGIEFLSIGKGEVDHRRALELLATIDYDGYISGEWINWEPADVHLPRERKLLGEILDSIGCNA